MPCSCKCTKLCSDAFSFVYHINLQKIKRGTQFHIPRRYRRTASDILCCKRSESATSLSISMRITDHIHIVITATTAHNHINSSHVFALLSINSVFLSELYVLYHLILTLSIGKIYIQRSSHIISLSTAFFVSSYCSIKNAIVLLI